MGRWLVLLACCVFALGCATTSGGAQPSSAGPPERDENPHALAAPASPGEAAPHAPDALVAELLRGARFVPEYQAGTPDGFKLAGIRPGSIYARHGMQNGDVIKRINSVTLDSPKRLAEAFDLVQEAGHAAIELLRGDEPMTLRVELLPAP